MIVGPCFTGDNNEALMMAQYDLYCLKDCEGFPLWEGYRGGTLSYLLRSALIALDNMAGNKSSFKALLKQGFEKNTSFDHRVLQWQHDLIAAYYRLININIIPPVFSVKEDYYRKFLIGAWKKYLLHEIHDLMESFVFCEAIVESVVYENTDRGYESEDRANNFLYKRYGRRCIELCASESNQENVIHRQNVKD